MKKITNDIFLKKSILKHNNFYTYPDEYKNSKTKIKIICPIHGEFYQYPNHHLTSNIPCIKCRTQLKNEEIFKKFVIFCNNIHNNFYNYNISKYINNKIKIKIECPIHGYFYQRPDVHLYQKQGCPNCYNDKLLTLDKFVLESNKIHNNKYDYSLINKLTKNVNIICPIHGIFKQRIYNHLYGQGCPNCNNSKGENIIEKYLIENKIQYVKQKKFNNCKNKRQLPFDFYLLKYNICIEYDGKYHYENDYIKNNDNIKTNFCKNNNIKLLRFNLSNIKNLDKICKKENII